MQDNPKNIDQDIKQIELELKREELNNLRTGRKFMWLNPAALGVLLPIVGAAALFIINEIRGYNEAYRAIGELAASREETTDLQTQKANLNQEIVALLALKDHFSNEANRMETLLANRQTLSDQMYLRAKFAAHEAQYAMAHATQTSPRISDVDLRAALDAAKALDEEAQTILAEVTEKYQIFFDMSDVSKEELSALLDTLDAFDPSEEARRLDWNPSGLIAGRNIMTIQNDPNTPYYDVGLGRFLTDSEMETIRDPN